MRLLCKRCALESVESLNEMDLLEFPRQTHSNQIYQARGLMSDEPYLKQISPRITLHAMLSLNPNEYVVRYAFKSVAF